MWSFLDAWDSGLRRTSKQWNVPGRYRLHGELFFFPSGEGANGLQGAESAGAQHQAAWRASPPSEVLVALFVIGLHGPGDVIAHFLQDGEVAKVALSCHVALDMLCQELYEVERRRGRFGFRARPVLAKKGKEANGLSF